MSNHATITWQDIDAARSRFQRGHVHATADELNAEMAVLADERIVRKMTGGRWIADPEVDNVWGWQAEGMTGRSVAVVYYRHEADFECDGDWEVAQ